MSPPCYLKYRVTTAKAEGVVHLLINGTLVDVTPAEAKKLGAQLVELGEIAETGAMYVREQL